MPFPHNLFYMILHGRRYLILDVRTSYLTFVFWFGLLLN